MLSNSNSSVKNYLNNNFIEIFTRLILFELVEGIHTLPKEDLYKIDMVIKYHENEENYEICEKIMKYKNKYV